MASSANTSSQGWENTNRGWKYKESNGSYVTNTWKQVDGIWYFLMERDIFLQAGDR